MCTAMVALSKNITELKRPIITVISPLVFTYIHGNHAAPLTLMYMHDNLINLAKLEQNSEVKIRCTAPREFWSFLAKFTTQFLRIKV